MRTLIYIGGSLWSICFLFHLFFWRLFDWRRELEAMKSVNKGIIQVLNLCLMLCFLIFAYVSFAETNELLSSSLGTAILAGMATFGLVRFGLHFLFFDIRTIGSKLVLIGALAIGIVYAIPLFG